MMAPSAERSPEGEELTRKENRAAWGIPRDGRSEAQPKWVPESRADDCIKLKTKWTALEALVGNPKRCHLSPHRPQSRNHMKLPQSDKLVVEREKIADYLLNRSHRYGGS